MPNVDRTLGDFRPGDGVAFRRTFSTADFAAFAKLSGDRNPLHHDAGYAKAAGYGATIVPVHLTAAPLSAVAGMMLPGHRSLYLQHKVRALHPIRYDEPVDYSAVVTRVSGAHGTLSIRAIAITGADVALEADMTVGVRDDVDAAHAPKWDGDAPIWSREPRSVVVTGSLGGVGTAVALALARAGRPLLLLHRGADRAAAELVERCKSLGVVATHLPVDLSNASDLAAFATELRESNVPFDLVHCASPAIGAPLAAHMAVSYSALRLLAEAVLPAALRRQAGTVLLVGSSGLQFHPPGMEDYLAAKAAATDFVASLDQRYRSYGVRGVVLAPGYISGSFSRSVREGRAPALLPDQVAEAVADLMSADGPGQASYVWLETSGAHEGRYGLQIYERQRTEAPDASSGSGQIERSAPATARGADIGTLVREFLGLPAGIDMTSAAVEITEGWDSLRHIELILHLERTLGIRFESSEIEKTTRFGALGEIVAQKLIDANQEAKV